MDGWMDGGWCGVESSPGSKAAPLLRDAPTASFLVERTSAAAAAAAAVSAAAPAAAAADIVWLHCCCGYLL
ncbi:unnamed protein product [Closterium sp. NIES-54]